MLNSPIDIRDMTNGSRRYAPRCTINTADLPQDDNTAPYMTKFRIPTISRGGDGDIRTEEVSKQHSNDISSDWLSALNNISKMSSSSNPTQSKSVSPPTMPPPTVSTNNEGFKSINQVGVFLVDFHLFDVLSRHFEFRF